MGGSKKTPKTPEEIQKEIQDFFKDKFGADILTVPLGSTAPDSSASEEKTEEPPEDELPDEILRFNLVPADVKVHLDRWVIGQEDAKRSLAVAVCDHYNHVRRVLETQKTGEPSVEYVKQNVILLGPTGVGKTYLLRILAQLIGVPFVKADITKFSETGYVGGDVEDLVRELHRMAGGNAALAEQGIIFLDEIDKIASSPNAQGRDPSGRGVQVALLKLMEDTDVPIRNPMDLGAQFQDMIQMRRGGTARRHINTRHILFVVSGAFSGMPEIVEKRLSERNIGFTATSESDDRVGGNLLARAMTKDFIDFGFEPEFIGRLPIRVALDHLGEEELYRILKTSEGSILRQYRENFRGYGIEIAFEDESLRKIAAAAHEEKTGARGLMTVLESRLRDYKFHLPRTPVKGFAVTPGLVDDPISKLEEVLGDSEAAWQEYAVAGAREWEDDFARVHGVRLRLDDEAIGMAVNVARQLDVKISEHLDRTFLEHKDFLRKILEQSGRSELPVTPHVLSRPAEGVELWLEKKNAET